MLTSITFNWETKDKTKIFAQKWLSGTNPRAAIIIVHGLGEHSSRYAHIAKMFNDENIAVFSFDHRGHGLSGGSRGDIPSYDTACDDIDELIKKVKTEFPAIPIFLYGHSLGGAIVLNYGLTKNSQINGIICTSPGLGTNDPIPAIQLTLVKFLSRIAPKVTINNGLDVENLSHDQEVIHAYKNDPLVHPKISTRLALELVTQGQKMIQKADQFKYPLLLLQGEMDHLVNPKLTKQFAEKSSKINIRFIQFPDFYHEMHNELNNEEFLLSIKSWLNEQIQN